LFASLVEVSTELARTSARGKKIELIAACLKLLAPDERAIGARDLAGELPYKTGIGYALVHELAQAGSPAAASTLTVADVDRRFAALAALRGAGSANARKQAFGAMLAAATAPERSFLCALAVGELRQGALDGLVVEGIARATALPAADLRRAYMLAGDLGEVAAAALGQGAPGLARFGLTLFQPVRPMLAQTAEDAAAALAELGGEAALETKLDGARVQIHKDGELVRVFSRALNEVTPSVGEVVDAVRALPLRRAILDGEAIALGPDGRPRAFQDTMRRFGRRGDEPALRAELPLSLAVFDALLIDDDTLIAEPARRRFAAIEQVAPRLAVPRVVTANAAAAAAFYDRMIAAGHEGIVAKALDAPYDAGSRGAAWLKIKRVRRLDLVVLAAEWGAGRRRGWLSNLHLGARDPAGGFVMLGKTFKGLTDELLRWQTAELLARELGRDGHVVYVRPELVAEIAFNEVQRSPTYPGGVALRFARVVRYRDDKPADQADTIDMVRAFAIADGALEPPP
jgi:DNA ligase-1